MGPGSERLFRCQRIADREGGGDRELEGWGSALGGGFRGCVKRWGREGGRRKKGGGATGVKEGRRGGKRGKARGVAERRSL